MSNLSTTTQQLLPNESLGITFNSPLILGTKPSAAFDNPLMSLKLTRDGIAVENTGESNKFPAMLTDRNNAGANLAMTPEVALSQLSHGKVLSNIGISVPITVTIGQENYALMVLRAHDNRFMLLSGYVNSARDDGAYSQLSLRGLYQANAVGEIGEEIIPVGSDKKVPNTFLSGSMINQVASEISLYGHDFPFGNSSVIWQETGRRDFYKAPEYDSLSYERSRLLVSLETSEIPSYLSHNMHPVNNLMIDGEPMTCGFQYAQQWNAGQVFFPMKLTLHDTQGLFLYHAEDRLNNENKAELVTMLDRKGLVLVKLDTTGMLTDKVFNFYNGNLVPAEIDGDPMNRKFSEAFAPSPIPGVKGFVNQSDVPYKDMPHA